MDPSNPYRFWDQNFVDLMNSQENSNCSDNPIPPNSTQSSQTIQFSNPFSSQPLNISHPFSSQPLNQTPTSESEDCLEVSTDETDEEGGRGIKNKDPVVSNEQRKNSFWKRVADYYKAHVGGTSSNERGTTQCKARWSKINHQVNKFVGCYAQAKCGNKRTKLASEGEFAATSSNGGDEMRPPGVKAAKKKGKKPAVSSDVSDGSIHKLDKIIAMKDQEQAAKERHGKMRLLDSLLNKSELTPAEVLLRASLSLPPLSPF
ncbi:PREDICTED: uncharacterized protein LOC109131145 [Camelina sativa]|uniref:Uncharacterized protein LOC109131145 n=1 Tax=Camelina sativa TaxID=90675 RepID=A0ABM1RE81_CAMSA|nr:PREDICTED: uncharacterized protein LOC109131145 [Camelina sativa]